MKNFTYTGRYKAARGYAVTWDGYVWIQRRSCQGVSEKGIISGELVGISEDSETHGCVDFFRVPVDTNVSDYFG